jgi:hypothetical protein
MTYRTAITIESDDVRASEQDRPKCEYDFGPIERVTR